MLILASSAKHRKKILEDVGLKVDKMISPDVDETLLKGENPHLYVQRIAKLKAQKIYKDNKNAFIVSADSIACVGKRVLLKPKDDVEQKKMLDLISGRKISYLTGHCVISPDGRKSVRYCKTSAVIKRMTDKEKQDYIKLGEAKYYAGGFAVDGFSSKYVKQISGSYTNIIGLCAYSVNNMLVGLGYKN